MRIKDLIKQLQEHDPEEIVCYDMWTVEDVDNRADDLDVVLTAEQCEGVLESMEDNFDANYGINWDCVDVYIREVEVK